MRRWTSLVLFLGATLISPSVVADSPDELRLTGRVIDHHNEAPIAGAKVLLFRERWREIADRIARNLPFAELETDAEGRYSFEGETPDIYPVAIVVSKDGYFEYHTSEAAGAPGSGTCDFPPIRLSRGKLVTGRVIDADGEPATSGVVKISIPKQSYLRLSKEPNPAIPRSTGTPPTVLIQPDGTFRFHVCAEAWECAAYVPGHAVTKVIHDTRLADPGPLVIELDRGHEVQVRVTRPDGTPIGGARVTTANLFAGTTDLAGGLRVQGLPPAPCYFQVWHPEHLPSETDYSEEGVVKFVMTPARWLTGRFVDEAGNPVDASGVQLREGGVRLVWIHSTGRGFRSNPMDVEPGDGRLRVPGYMQFEVRWPKGSGAFDLGDVVVRRGNRIRLTVVDTKGTPLPDSHVRITESANSSGFRTQDLAGESGTALIGGLPATALRLEVSRRGYRLFERRVVVTDGFDQSITATLHRGATVRFRVVDIAGRPIESAHATIAEPIGDSGRRFQRGRSDAEGRLEIDRVRFGESVELKIDLPDYEPFQRSLDRFIDEEVRDLGEIVLLSGSTIFGVVRNDIGEPVEGARVNVFADDPDHPRRHLRKVTDASGVFEFGGLVTGDYRVRTSARGHRGVGGPGESSSSTTRVAVGERERVEVDLTLERTEVHRFTAEYSDGTPIEGVSAVISSRIGRGKHFNAYSDSEGRLSFPPLPPGTLMLQLSFGWQRKTFEYASVEEIPERFVLERGGELVIRVAVPDGVEPPPYVMVVSRSKSGGDDSATRRGRGLGSAQLEDGVAEFLNLPPGEYECDLVAPGFTASPRQLVVDTGSRVEWTWELRQEALLELDFRVVDSSGTPIPGARVAPYGILGGETDDNGTLVASGRTPCHGYSVEADGYVSVRFHRGEPLESGKIVVRLDAEARLLLRVESADGAPVEGVHVFANVSRESSEAFDERVIPASGSGRTDGDGAVSIGGLPSGRARVEVRHEDSHVTSFEVPLIAGESHRETVRIPDPIVVTGWVKVGGEPPNTPAMTVGRVGGRGPTHGRISADGSYSVVLYERGEYHFSIVESQPTQSFSAVHTIEESQRLDLEFDLFRVEGIVVDPSGSPVAGALVFLSRHRFTTDADGRFDFERVVAGEHKVRVTAEGLYYSDVDIDLDRDVEIEARAEETTSVTLRSTRALSALSVGTFTTYRNLGSVTDASEITLHIPPGVHRVQVSGRESDRSLGQYLEIEVPVDRAIALDLRPTEHQAVHFGPASGPTEHGVAIVRDEAGSSVFPWEECAVRAPGFLSLSLPPGGYSVEVRMPSWTASRDFTVAPVERAGRGVRIRQRVHVGPE